MKLIVALLLLLSLTASAQSLHFSSDYGSQGLTIEQTAPQQFSIKLGAAPHQPGWPNKLNGMMTGARGRQPQLIVRFDGGKQYPFNEYFQSYSYDRINWQPLRWRQGHRKSPQLDTLDFPLLQRDTVYFGTQVPLTWADYRTCITRWKTAGARITTLGKSLNGRPLHRISIGNIRKPKAQLWVAGQHPGEHNAQWRLVAMVDWLLSAEGAAARQQLLVHFVPVMSPDALGQGWYRVNAQGHDMNRTYRFVDSAGRRCHEASIIEKDLLALHKAQPLTAVFSIHTWPGLVDMSKPTAAAAEEAQFGPLDSLQKHISVLDAGRLFKPLYYDRKREGYESRTWAAGPGQHLGISSYLVEGGGDIYYKDQNLATGRVLMEALARYYGVDK